MIIKIRERDESTCPRAALKEKAGAESACILLHRVYGWFPWILISIWLLVLVITVLLFIVIIALCRGSQVDHYRLLLMLCHNLSVS